MNRDNIIRMAREAGARPQQNKNCDVEYVMTGESLERFAAIVAAEKEKRADALAATIVTLRDIVTNDAESKADFITRVREVLGSRPDHRVLYAVEAEREASAKFADQYMRDCEGKSFGVGNAIRARAVGNRAYDRYEGETK